MKLKNGFKLIYEKKVEEKRKLFASKKGIPAVDDEAIDVGLTEEEIEAAKLIYEKDDSLVASNTGIPAADDKAFKLTVDGEEVIGEDN